MLSAAADPPRLRCQDYTIVVPVGVDALASSLVIDQRKDIVNGSFRMIRLANSVSKLKFIAEQDTISVKGI